MVWISTQNMNFKCWRSRLMVMDQRVQLWWREQWKMVRNLIVCNSCNSTFGWFSRAYHFKVGLT